MDAIESFPVPLQKLFSGEAKLPAKERNEILAMGSSAVPALLNLLQDESWAPENAPGAGYVPLHAARLLGDLGDPSAIQPMISALVAADAMEFVYAILIDSLAQFRGACVEPLLAAYAQTENPKSRLVLAEVSAKLGVQDERIYEILLHCLQTDLVLGAIWLADYGDPRALSHLSEALDAHEVRAASKYDLLSNQEVFEIEAAIAALGGALTADQQAKVKLAHAPREQYRRELHAALKGRELGPPPVKAQQRPGRNEPCHCGSGTKYKRCHLATDPRTEA
ncbi:MAG: SEC-C metal-binding domain-containing protein [Myxococcaceae bacterium]